MPFYNLPKNERLNLVATISNHILNEVKGKQLKKTLTYFTDEDTYIRKLAYLSLGRIYVANKQLQQKIIKILNKLLPMDHPKIRQTVINAAGEIGKRDFERVQHIFDKGLFDKHYSPRNAVIGSIKKMGEINPMPVLRWTKKYILHEDKEIRRQVCHGVELRGRKHPQDVLPLLKELENDKTARVRNTLVHVIGQISYKKGCLPTVIEHLKKWKNKQLVADALEEIIDVHQRYKTFSSLTREEAAKYITIHFR